MIPRPFLLQITRQFIKQQLQLIEDFTDTCHFWTV